MSKAANGNGSISKRTKVVSGKTYTWFQARYTDGSGQRHTVTAPTQSQCAAKLRQITHEIDCGTHIPETKMNVRQWAEIWSKEYLTNAKPHTVDSYNGILQNHILPHFGATKLQKLTPADVQKFVNKLQTDGLSPKTIKNIHGVLHALLAQAVINKIITCNAADNTKLPKVKRTELKPLSQDEQRQFLSEIRGTRFEHLFQLALFTGMRQSEILGLQWDDIDFEKGTINIQRQLQKGKTKGSGYTYQSLKNGESRLINPAPIVMDILRKQHSLQAEDRMRNNPVFENHDRLVFTDEVGKHLVHLTVFKDFKRHITAINRPDFTFHDLRHQYAINALCAGTDFYSLSKSMGHSSIGITLDVYSSFSDEMRKAASEKMQSYLDAMVM